MSLIRGAAKGRVREKKEVKRERDDRVRERSESVRGLSVRQMFE